MAFISLPSELLSQIAQIVSQAAPNDIEDLGRACRRLRNISWPLIIEHRKSLVEYTRVDANNAVAANLLFEICRRPWVAIYPKSLDLTANKHLRTLQRPKTVKQVALVDAFKAKSNTVSDEDLEETLFRTGLIPKAHAAWWVESIRHGDEDYLFAALLACLPNVERLNIGLDLEKLEQTKEMLRNIKKEWNQNLALTKLTTVQVRERDGARHCDLELFPLLAAIPGVQKLHASNLTGMYRECYRDGWLSYPGASASITHIRLETCGMSVEGLEMLMKSLSNLQEFHYIHHRPGWGMHSVSSLLRHAKSTLHTLTISAGGGSCRYIGTLRDFTALRFVTVDTDMLIRNGKMQRFVDVMPASIESCTIAGNSLTKPMENRFLADLYRPSFFYPNLKKIFAEDSWGLRNIGQDRLKFQREFHKQTTWMTRYK